MMTGRERLQCALRHEIPDTVPMFEVIYSRPLFEEVLGYCPETFDAANVLKCCAKIGYDFAFLTIPGNAGFRPKGITTEEYTDEWGITYRISPRTWPIDAAIKNPCSCAEDWENYQMPDPNADFRYEDLEKAMELAKEYNIGVIGNVRGPYSSAWHLFGMEGFFEVMLEDPDVAEEVLTATTDFDIACMRRMVKLGVDAVKFSDDYGSVSAPLMSPAQFRKLILPQLERIRKACDEEGIPMILHSDGHLHQLLPDIMSSGIDGLHPIERSAGMDLGEVKAAYGDRVCLFGNLDNKRVLLGSKEEIEEAVKECIRTGAPGGGYCLGSDHSVHDDIPNESVFTMYEAGRKYGKYPISL